MSVVLCRSMQARLIAEGVPAARVRVVHNWVADDIERLPRARSLSHGDAPADPFTICYSGNLGRVHDVDAIIDLIRRTADLAGLRFRFVGGGVAQARLRAAIAAHGWTHITFEPYAPRDQLGPSLAASDAHLVTLDPACESLIQPSKLYGVLAAGRPTLFLGAGDGAVARLLARHAAGVTLDPAAPDTWRPLLAALIADSARLEEMGRNARRAHEADYARRHALAAWREVLAPLPVPAGPVPEPADAARAHSGAACTAGTRPAVARAPAEAAAAAVVRAATKRNVA